MPGSIPAGGSAEILTTFRPGFQSGRKRVEFAILTDREDDPVVTYSLTASLASEIEVVSADPNGADLAVGKSGTQKFTVICRRLGDQGRGAPSLLKIRTPASARFGGPASTVDRADGVSETTRTVEVTLPPSAEPGVHRAELFLFWDNPKREHRRPIEWSVSAALRATPPVLVFKLDPSEPMTRDVVVESTGSEFRVLGVEGKALGEGLQLPTNRAKSHRLSVPMMRSKVIISDLRIKTDHPDQPDLKVGVYIPPASGGDEQGGHPR